MIPPPIPIEYAGVAPQPAAPQISEENLRQLAAARTCMTKIRRAVSVAKFDGWSIGIFAALTLMFAIPSLSVSGILAGVALAVIAVVELYSADRLRRLDQQAIRVLTMNQIVFACLLTVYALWSMHALTTGPGLLSELSDPSLAAQLRDTGAEDITRQIMLATYISLIAVALFGQGGLALYYHTRRKHVVAYLTQTPAWIVTMQKANVSL